MCAIAKLRGLALAGAAAAIIAASADAAGADERAAATRRPLELTGGVSALLVQSYLFNHTGLALEAMLEGPLAAAWAWGVGGRIDPGTGRPDGFARVCLTPELDRWRGRVGLELGVTARTRYGEASGGVGKALRAQAQDDLSPLYLGVHAAPARFRLARRFLVSLLELQVGTHLGAPGEHARVQVGLLSLGASL